MTQLTSLENACLQTDIEHPPHLTDLICSSDNEDTFNTETAKEYCRNKFFSSEIDENSREYYQLKYDILLRNFRPDSPNPIRKITHRSLKKSH